MTVEQFEANLAGRFAFHQGLSVFANPWEPGLYRPEFISDLEARRRRVAWDRGFLEESK